MNKKAKWNRYLVVWSHPDTGVRSQHQTPSKRDAIDVRDLHDGQILDLLQPLDGTTRFKALQRQNNGDWR